jgi:6-phosphogluconolactonase (cycloisomerase 2 family)
MFVILVSGNPRLAWAGTGDFVEVHKDGVGGVDGLDYAYSVTVSPDGNHVYAAGYLDDAVAVFNRNASTGVLTFVEVLKDGVGGVDGLGAASSVTVSADGNHVYATGYGDDAVAVFSRNASTGVLTFVEMEKDGVGGVDGLDAATSVTVSADGNHVYATGQSDDAVTVFSRNASTGALTFVEMHKDGVGGVDGLDGVLSVTVSPDGKHVYAASHDDSAVALFSRTASTGELRFVEMEKDGVDGVDGLDAAVSVTLSPDGNHVYAAGYDDDAVAVFSRDSSTGGLTFVEVHKDGAGGVDGLNGARTVTVSSDGNHVYAGSHDDDAVAVFGRNASSGALTYVEMHKDGADGVDGLDYVTSVTVSPDGKHLYATGALDSAVAVFRTIASPPIGIISGTIILTVRQHDASAVPSTTKVGNTLYVSGKTAGYNNVQVIVAAAAGAGSKTATVENTTVSGTKLSVTLTETSASGGIGLVQYQGVFFVDTTTTAETSTTAGDGIIGASDGDIISVASGDVARLTVDAKGPKITGISPLDDDATRATTIDFVATITDAGSGIVADSADADSDGVKTEPISASGGTTDNINIQINPASAGTVATGTENSSRALWATANDGYSFTFAKVMTEAAHTWFIKATDRVGNSDQTDSDADTSGDQDTSFTVDATAAIMGVVTTGIKWDNTNNDEDPSRSHIKVAFTATGGLVADNMDAATLSAADFLVDGAAIAGMVHPNLKSSKGVDLDGNALSTKNIVYLELSADIAADAKPKVSLVGTVNDLAGNASAPGEKKASDGNAPKFTVTITGNADADGRPIVQGDTDGDKITVRVASDETLVAAPTIKFGTLTWAGDGALTFVEMEKDGVGGVDGLDAASSVTVSPDGNHVYATALEDDAVAVFSRNSSTGALAYVEMHKDGVGGVDGLDGATSVAVNPDGNHVYVAGTIDDAVAVFSRNASTGALTYLEMHKDGVGGVDGLDAASSVTVSPDGNYVYAAGIDDDAVAVFSRNASTGALTFAEWHKDGIGGVDGLDGARSVTVSADGKHVYAVGSLDDAVAVFSRNASIGGLTYVEMQKDGVGGVDGLDGAASVTVSADGNHVYAAGIDDDAVAVFSRNASTGALTFVEMEKDGVGGVDGLDGARSVTVSPDGNHVYVAGTIDDAVVVFSRNASTGALRFEEMRKDGVGGVDGLDSARSVTMSPDGNHVYAASHGDDAVAAFIRESSISSEHLEVAASTSITPSSVSGLTNTWETSKLKADIGNVDGLITVYVSGTDLSSNTGTSGSGSAAAGTVDLTKANLFEIDNNIGAPTFTLTPNTGTTVGTTTESTGPFIRIDFPEGKEYSINSLDKLEFGSPAVSVEIDDHDDITISAITLDGTDVSASLGSVDSDSYVLATSGLVVGEHELKLTYNDSVGNKKTDQGYSFMVDERSQYEVKLSPGWNLVSIPGTPAAPAIDDVIGSTHPAISVLTYESGEWKVATRGTGNAWEGTVAQIDADHAYWVQTSAFTSIKTLINEHDPATSLPTIPVVAGWNLVPVVDLQQTAAPTQAQLAANSHGFTAAAYFASLTWTVAYGFDTLAPTWRKITATTGDNLGQGKGYWVWATKAGELVP